MYLVYIAGPYRADTFWEIEQNIQKAKLYAARVIKDYNGEYYPVIPHSNTGHFGGLKDEKYFLEGTMEQLKRCDAIVLIPGWDKSKGSIAEFKYALDNDMPILKIYDN